MSRSTIRIVPAACLFVLAVASKGPSVFCAEATSRVLPYEVTKKTLPNGLDVLVIETPEFQDVLSFNVLILAGSRNETEKGRTGLAHLFEHIAFRHKYDKGGDSYSSRMESMGAFDNGWTWFDVTYYHPVTFTSNLEKLIRIQSERFVSMDFSERIYRTEAGAVLGEYRRIASDPGLRMEEVQADLAYGTDHGYGHTTMGYLQDVRKMPESYASGRKFYETYYRPNNAVVIIVGDVDTARVLRLVEQAFGAWESGVIPEQPEVKEPQGPLAGHVDWDSEVAPRILFGYLIPPFRPGSRESAVHLLLPELLAGKTAPLYRKLRYEKKLATAMGVGLRGSQGFDARLLEASVRLDRDLLEEREIQGLFAEVTEDLVAGFDELKTFSRRDGASGLLPAIQSKFRYDLLASLDSPHDIAMVLAWYYRFNRDPAVLETIVEAAGGVTPEDVDAFAAKYFVPERRVVVTMSHRAPAGSR